ncbi:MAG: signal recognition particle-docking protein FtsY [Acidimicrobiia bacterium]
MTTFQLILIAGIAIIIVAGVLIVLTRRSTSPTSAREARPGGPAYLDKTRSAFGGRLRRLFGVAASTSEFWEGLEEALLAADVGVVATDEIVQRVKGRHPEGPEEARRALREELLSEFGQRPRDLCLAGVPSAIVVVGVNGTGKTTTIAKLAALFARQGKTVILGAADTFRAGADVQLKTWAERVGADIVSGQEGSDPASVAFDTYEAAKARGHDVAIIDTAGRLHSKHNLMQELGKVVRVLARTAGEVGEILLVIDATNGQNAVSQARVFTEQVGVTGVVLTKLDGTARGGVVVAVERELDIPVKLIGIGESVGDLIPFVPSAFVDALLEDA